MVRLRKIVEYLRLRLDTETLEQADEVLTDLLCHAYPTKQAQNS